MLKESKIRQELLANRGYGDGVDKGTENKDRFRVRMVERVEQPIVYARVIGHDPVRMTDAYDRLMVWGREHSPEGRLIGRSADDPDITPVDRCRFDWCLTVPADVRAGSGLNCGVVSAGRFAVVRCRGDLHKEYRAWTYLFRVWLPRSGFEPDSSPAFEWNYRDPMITGWSALDIDCYLPIRPLGRLTR